MSHDIGYEAKVGEIEFTVAIYVEQGSGVKAWHVHQYTFANCDSEENIHGNGDLQLSKYAEKKCNFIPWYFK